MLLNFSVENWMSYRDEATLPMIGSLERQHKKTLAKMPDFRSRWILPVAAVYGGNASGKTALFKAVAALRRLGLEDVGVDGRLDVQPFLLRHGALETPVTFDVTYLFDEVAYRLVVSATRRGVASESLEVLTEKRTTVVYERERSEEGDRFVFDDRFFADAGHVEYAAKSTRGNQLFLSSAVAQNVNELSGAYRWFSDVLELVGVESHSWSFAKAIGDQEGFFEFAEETLARLDTGIVGLMGEPVALESLPHDAAFEGAIASLEDDQVVTLVLDRVNGDYGFELVTVSKTDGQVVAERMRTLHRMPDGDMRAFNLSAESSGTQRLLGLLPMLFDLVGEGGKAGSKVYVVDELDRCFHTMLTARLIENFTAGCGPSTRKQLLFTTHDLLLMDQHLMRRDEMFIAQRGVDGRSELIGLAEFEGIRYDKDLIRSYLDGRFGGIPLLSEEITYG